LHVLQQIHSKSSTNVRNLTNAFYEINGEQCNLQNYMTNMTKIVIIVEKPAREKFDLKVVINCIHSVCVQMHVSKLIKQHVCVCVCVCVCVTTLTHSRLDMLSKFSVRL